MTRGNAVRAIVIVVVVIVVVVEADGRSLRGAGSCWGKRWHGILIVWLRLLRLLGELLLLLLFLLLS